MKCYACDQEGKYETTMVVFEAGSGEKEIVEKCCRDHFMEAEFGLWPLYCSDDCFERRKTQYAVAYTEDDRPIWVSIKAICSIEEGEPPIKCPWCGKTLGGMVRCD